MTERAETIRRALHQAVVATESAPEPLRPHLAAVVLDYLLRSSSSVLVGVPSGESIAEAFQRLSQRSQPEQIIAIAAHRLGQNIDALTISDFEAAYEEARLPVPNNMFETLRRCVQRGWLTAAAKKDGRRAWRITQTGLAHVEAWRSHGTLG